MDQTIFRQQVLQRYVNVEDSLFGDQEGPLSKRNQDFVSVLVRAFEEDDSFDYSEFNRFSLSAIIDYIRRTHRLYLNKTLNEIEQSIGLLNEAYRQGHPLLDVLNAFYLEYKSDLISHIRLEDEKLLPYISKIVTELNHDMDLKDYYFSINRFSIHEFLEGHHDNDSVLDEVRFKILTYDPPLVNRFIYNVLLNQLEFFARDLKIHGRIEEEVLIPAALEIEKELEFRFQEKLILN
jgi:regulator of cell morphogenesis and NO signaling